MLTDKIAKELYDSYSETAERTMLKEAKYKDAANCVTDVFKEVKEVLPEDKLKLLLKLESAISHRESLYAREAYKHGFTQGARFIIELLSDK